jgi:hypothetical protein
MKIVKRTVSASIIRFVLPLLWIIGVAGVVGWAGRGGDVATATS